MRSETGAFYGNNRNLQSNCFKIIRKANGVEYVWGFHPAYQQRQYGHFGIKP